MFGNEQSAHLSFALECNAIALSRLFTMQIQTSLNDNLELRAVHTLLARPAETL